jgi:hypothetical protein
LPAPRENHSRRVLSAKFAEPEISISRPLVFFAPQHLGNRVDSRNIALYSDFTADLTIFPLESVCYAPVAQLDRASVYGTEGCRFEPCQVYLINKDLRLATSQVVL